MRARSPGSAAEPSPAIIEEVRLAPQTSPAANFAFDVTPARLITGLITERGICAASGPALSTLYPESGSKDTSG